MEARHKLGTRTCDWVSNAPGRASARLCGEMGFGEAGDRECHLMPKIIDHCDSSESRDYS